MDTAGLAGYFRLLQRTGYARLLSWRLAAVALGVGFAAVYARAFYTPFPLLDWYKVGHAGFATISHYDAVTAAGLAGAGLGLLLLSRQVWTMARERPGAWMLAVIVLGWLGASAWLLWTQPGQSTDLFDYQFHAHMLVHLDKNPLVTPPSDLIAFEDFPFLSWYWEADPYGPIWLALTGGLHALVGEDLLANILMFKLLAVAATGIAGVFVYASLRQVAPAYAPAGLAFWLWNPLVLNEGALHGHNDLVMVALMLGGMWLVGRGRGTAGILALTCAGLVKVSAWVLLPVVVVWFIRKWGWRAGPVRLLPGFAAGALLVWVTYLPFGGVENLLATIHYRGWWSTNTWTNFVLASLTNNGWPLEMAAQWVIGVESVVFACIAGYLLLRMRDLRTGAFALMLAYVLVASHWFQPWYAVWALALAAIIPNERILAYGRLLTAFMLLHPILSQFWVAQVAGPGPYDLIMAAITLLVPQVMAARLILRGLCSPQPLSGEERGMSFPRIAP